MPAVGFTYNEPPKNGSDWYTNRQWAYLELRGSQLFAEQQGSGAGEWVIIRKMQDSIVAVSEEPVVIFIPDTASAPVLKPDEEMWVEVTVPAKGPPRPIRMGIKKDGVITPVRLN
jgi:hypothetical protein